MTFDDPATWPLWLIITAASFVALILLFIFVKILLHKRHKKDKLFLKADLTSEEGFTKKKSDKPVSDRISIFNLFWDLGADEQAYKIIHDLGLTSWKKRKFTTSRTKRVSNLISKAGGYHLFVQTLLNTYSIEGIPAEMSRIPSYDKRLEIIANRVTQAGVNFFSEMGVSAKDAPSIGKKAAMSSAYAAGDMTGIPVKEIALVANLPKMKNMAMVYYRINRQSGTKPQAIFRTAEEMATTIAAGTAGNVLGAMAGFAIAEEGISNGDFDFLDVDGDGLDDLEVFVIKIACGTLFSIVTGKFFKNISNWWNTRTLRGLKADFDRECASIYSWAFGDENAHAVVERNLNIFIDYWQQRYNQLIYLFRKNDGKFTRLEKTLAEEAEFEMKAIYMMHQREKNSFLASVEKLKREKKQADAGRLLLFHREQLFRGLENEISSHLERIREALRAVNEEVKNLKAKGKIQEPKKAT